MPLKSIARCSVSKRWAFVLRRPDFTELFFTRSLARTLLLLARIKEEEVIFFSTPQPQNLGENVSLEHGYYLSNIINGFFCISHYRVLEGRKFNPSTKQSFPLPKMKKTREMADMRRFFGYDPVEIQHKALSVTMLDDNSVVDH
ncbi:putative F-box protein At3g23960 [Brassica napus]|uniref:putative F-box protein At3g23960 n=1 Tax=Brassica napus TaxID=3708 RepID=UPI0006AA9D24|nr:putative F-box protein At3g23960 [Brassica napus]